MTSQWLSFLRTRSNSADLPLVAPRSGVPAPRERMIESARQALAFARGRGDHGFEVHVPDDIDVKAIREKISLSQGEFAKLSA